MSLGASTTPETTQTTTATEEVSATADARLIFFYSPTCPHCQKEKLFLETLSARYPELVIEQYLASDSSNHQLMDTLLSEQGAERYRGIVPLTFVGGEYFVGYRSAETTGADIERAVRVALGKTDAEAVVPVQRINVPLLGAVNPQNYSLPVLAALLGFLDGFNVCSLGALVLIIGLALKLQSRRAVLLFGGLFVLTTALVYGGLIMLWYKLFEALAASLPLMQLGIAFLALGGGMYFMKEYLKLLKQGPVCEFSQLGIVARLQDKTQNALQKGKGVLAVGGAVLLFAGVVAIVEFPCSAAVPVVFAGILAEAGMGTAAYLSHIGIFVLFYLIDELVLLGIAAWRLRLWLSNPSFTKWAVLAEALILLAIGLFYTVSFF